MKYATLEDRIIANSYHDENGCWIWLGARLKSGYGRINVWTPAGEHFATLAHRASWQAFRKPDAYGRDVHHVCRVRACVNPGHLKLMEHKENCQNGNRVNDHSGSFKKRLTGAV